MGKNDDLLSDEVYVPSAEDLLSDEVYVEGDSQKKTKVGNALPIGIATPSSDFLDYNKSALGGQSITEQTPQIRFKDESGKVGYADKPNVKPKGEMRTESGVPYNNHHQIVIPESSSLQFSQSKEKALYPEEQEKFSVPMEGETDNAEENSPATNRAKNYEFSQNYLKEADKKLQTVNSLSTGAYGGGIDYSEKTKAATERQTYSQRAKAAQEYVAPEIEKSVSETTSKLDNFTTETKRGEKIADPAKIDEWARNKAKENGLPETGYYQNLLKTSALAKVSYEIDRPKIEAKANEIFKKETGKDISESVQDNFSKGFVKKQEIETKAKLQIGAVQNEVKESLTADVDIAQKEFEPMVQSLKAKQDGLNQKVEQFNHAAESGQFQSQEQFDAAKASLEQEQQATSKEQDVLSAQWLDATSKIYGKGNARLRRQQEEIENGANAQLQKEYGEYAKAYKQDPKLAEQIKKAYSTAANEVGKGKQAYQNRINSFMPAPIRFGETFLSSLGNGIKNIAGAYDMNDVALMGERMAANFQSGDTQLHSWKDLADPSKLAASGGQLVGGMTPALAAGAITALVTEGLAAPQALKMVASSFAAWNAESTDIAQGMYNDVFAKTGSEQKANEAADKIWTSQKYLMPAYAFEMLPMFGSILKGVGGLGKRMAVGGAIEFGTEMLQEYPQNLVEEAVRNGGEISDAIKYNTLEKFNETALNIAPVFLLGGAGQVNAKISEDKQKQLAGEAAVKAAKYKAQFEQLDPIAKQQFVSDMVQQKGLNFAQSQITGMFSSGLINETDYNDLVKHSAKAQEHLEQTKDFTPAQQKVYSSLMFNLDAVNEKAAQATTPLVKAAYEKQAKELEDVATNVLAGKNEGYSVLTYPDNTQRVLPFAQMEANLKNKAFRDAFARGDIKVDVWGTSKPITETLEAIEPISPEPQPSEPERLIPIDFNGEYVSEGIDSQRQYLEEEILSETEHLKGRESKKGRIEKVLDRLSGVTYDDYLKRQQNRLSLLNKDPLAYFEKELADEKKWQKKHPNDANEGYMAFVSEMIDNLKAQSQPPPTAPVITETPESATMQDETVTNQTANEIAAKKADIEKRREEELKGEDFRVAVSEEIFEGDDIDNEGEKLRLKIVTNKDGSRTLFIGSKGNLFGEGQGESWKAADKIGKDNTLTNSEYINTAWKGVGENFNTEGSNAVNKTLKSVEAINAKYDAELSALGKQDETVTNGTVTPETKGAEQDEPTQEVRAEGGKVYRAADNLSDITGDDRSYSKGLDWYDGNGFLVEANDAKLGEEVPHHKGAYRGGFYSPTKVYYEPEAFTSPTYVKKQIAKFKAKYPDAKFVRIKANEGSDGNLAINIVPHGEFEDTVNPKQGKLSTLITREDAESDLDGYNYIVGKSFKTLDELLNYRNTLKIKLDDEVRGAENEFNNDKGIGKLKQVLTDLGELDHLEPIKPTNAPTPTATISPVPTITAETVTPKTETVVEADIPTDAESDSGGRAEGGDAVLREQIESFGVAKDQVKPTLTVISKIHEGLKKAGLTAAKTVGDWVGIGRGTQQTEALKQIIGEQGAGRLKNAEIVLADLGVAKKMEKAGKTPKEIHLATSWEKGVDGKWRFELPDIELVSEQLNKNEVKLGSIVKGELLKAYPKLKNIKVVFGAKVNAMGMWDKRNNSIYILLSSDRLKAKSEAYRVLIHEIQHAIQSEEGFATGGNLESVPQVKGSERDIYEDIDMDVLVPIMIKYDLAGDDMMLPSDFLKGHLKEVRSQNGDKKDIDFLEKEISKILKIEKENRFSSSEKYSFYERLAGEVEARNAETRMNMSSKERKEKMLSETEDIAREEQTVMRNTFGIKASVEGGQPLFKDAEAQYRIESGKNIVEAIKNFNGSPKAVVALTHEIMHPTVVAIIDGAKDGNAVGAKHTQTIVDEYNKANPKSKVTVEQLIEGNDAFKNGTTSEQYRAVQEFIAESWEKYHTEGGAGFSKAFQEVLEQITKAFQAVYSTIMGSQLTPELRAMFDELLGKESTETVVEEEPKSEKEGDERVGESKEQKNPLKAIFSKKKKVAPPKPIVEAKQFTEPHELVNGWHIVNKEGGVYTVVSQNTGQSVRVRESGLKDFVENTDSKKKALSLTDRDKAEHAKRKRIMKEAFDNIDTPENVIISHLLTTPINEESLEGLSGTELKKAIEAGLVHPKEKANKRQTLTSWSGAKTVSANKLAEDLAKNKDVQRGETDSADSHIFANEDEGSIKKLIQDTIDRYLVYGKGAKARMLADLVDAHLEKTGASETERQKQNENDKQREEDYDDMMLEEVGLTNEAVFAKNVYEAFGSKASEEQIAKYLSLVNARAKVWSDLTGLPSDKWYYRYVYDVKSGGDANQKGEVNFMSDNRAIIQAFEKADISTLIHETAHIWRRELYSTYDLMESGSEKDALSKDIEVLEKEMGVEGGVWSPQNEEKFARSFEQYLKTGKAPKKRLQGLYDSFKQWLGEIYNSDTLPIVSRNVREVFDRLFTGEYGEGKGNIGKGLSETDRLFQADEEYSEREIDSMLKEAITDALDEANQSGESYTYQEAYSRYLEANNYLEENSMKPIPLSKFQSIWLAAGGAEITAPSQRTMGKYRTTDSDETNLHRTMTNLKNESGNETVKTLAEKLEKYNVQKQEDAVKNANLLISDFGIDEAFQIASDYSNEMDASVRTAVLAKAVIHYSGTQNDVALEKALIKLKEWGKELGQGINMFKELYQSEPLAMWLMMKSDMRNIYENRFKKAQNEISKLRSSVLQLQKKLIKQATGNVLSSKKAKAAIDKAADLFDQNAEKAASVSKEKVSRFKELAAKIGKSANVLRQGDIEADADMVEMLSIAAEMGGNDIQSLYTVLQQQAGKSIAKSVLPYLQDAMPKLAESLKGSGVKFTAPSRTEIDKFLLQKSIGTTFLTKLKSKSAVQLDRDISENAVLGKLANHMANVIGEKFQKPRSAEERAKAPTKSAGQVIREAFDNIEKTKSILEAAKAEWKSQGASEAELQRLDDYFGDFFEKPFSEKEANRLKGEAIRKLGTQGNLTAAERNQQREDILDNVLSDLRLSDKAETELRSKIDLALRERSEERVASELEKLLNNNGKRQNSKVEERLRAFVNLNGLSDQAAIDAFVGKYGKRILNENVNDSARLSDADRMQAKTNAIDNIVAQLGLTGKDAADVSAMLGQKWDRLSADKRTAELNKVIAVAKKNGNVPKTVLETLNDFVNLNGLSDQAAIDAFVEKNGKKLLNAAIKKSGFENIKQVLESHLNGNDRTAAHLVQLLIDDLGLTQAQATDLAVTLTDEFKAEFDKLNVKKPIKEKVSKAEKLLQLVGSDAFSDKEFEQYFAKAQGWNENEIKPDENAHLKLLQERFDSAKDNLKKQRILDDTIKFIMSKEGTGLMEQTAALWYASVLSNPDTHGVNALANFKKFLTDVVALGIVKEGIKQSVKSGDLSFAKANAKITMQGLYKAYKEAGNIIAYGGSPIRGNAKMANFQPLEVKNTWLWKTRLRYIGRLLTAEDVMIYEPAREQMAFQLAYAKQIEKGFPAPVAVNKALEEINRTSFKFKRAVVSANAATAEYIDSINAEYDNKVDAVNNSTTSAPNKAKELAKLKTERERLIKRELSDTARRVYTMLDANVDAETLEIAKGYGQLISYNHTPNGAIGAAVNVLNKATRYNAFTQATIGKFARFLNTPTNVINEYLNYTPLGLLRAQTKYGSVMEAISRKFGDEKRSKDFFAHEKHPLTEREISDIRYKAFIASSAVIGVLAWAMSGGKDDDDEPLITGALTGNAGKNYDIQKGGIQRNSIRVGDTYISYEYWPSRWMFQAVGDLSDYMRYELKGKVPTKDDVGAMKMIGLQGTSIFNMIYMNSFMSSFDDLFEIIGKNGANNTGSDISERIANWGASQAIGYVPYSGLIRWGGNEYHNIKGNPILETKSNNSFETIMKRTAARTGALNNGSMDFGDKADFTPKIDILGNPIPRDSDRFFSTLKGEGISDVPKDGDKALWVTNHPNAMIDMLANMGEFKTNPSPNTCYYVTQTPDGKFVEKVTATPSEYETYIKIRNSTAFTKMVENFPENYKSYLEYTTLYKKGEYLKAYKVRKALISEIDSYYAGGNTAAGEKMSVSNKKWNQKDIDELE